MKRDGLIKNEYLPLKKDGDLAELIGVVLGDGHIWVYPRTEELSIFSNANNPGFVERYRKLVASIFGKNPKITFSNKQKTCIRIRIYEKYIAFRLGIPISPRLHKDISLPRWISSSQQYIVRYLRGLYEAEGSFSVHKPTSTYKLFFANQNASLLRIVPLLLRRLGFHVNVSGSKVQVSRKEDVYRLKELIEFRKY